MFSEYNSTRGDTALLPALIDTLTGNTPYGPPTSYYLSAWIIEPDLYTMAEVSSLEYVRQPFTMSAKVTRPDGSVYGTNANHITFPTPTSEWGWINYPCLSDKATAGNVVLEMGYVPTFEQVRITNKAWSLLYIKAVPADGKTVTIGSTVYRWKNSLSAAYDVKIGADVNACALNLAYAIRAETGYDGTIYGTGTVAHPTCTAPDPVQRSCTPGAPTAGNGVDPRRLNIVDVQYLTSGGNGLAVSTNASGSYWNPPQTLQGAGLALEFPPGSIMVDFQSGSSHGSLSALALDAIFDWLFNNQSAPSTFNTMHLYAAGVELSGKGYAAQSVSGVFGSYGTTTSPWAVNTSQVSFPVASSDWSPVDSFKFKDSSENILWEGAFTSASYTVTAGNQLVFPVPSDPPVTTGLILTR